MSDLPKDIEWKIGFRLGNLKFAVGICEPQ